MRKKRKRQYIILKKNKNIYDFRANSFIKILIYIMYRYYMK